MYFLSTCNLIHILSFFLFFLFFFRFTSQAYTGTPSTRPNSVPKPSPAHIPPGLPVRLCCRSSCCRSPTFLSTPRTTPTSCAPPLLCQSTSRVYASRNSSPSRVCTPTVWVRLPGLPILPPTSATHSSVWVLLSGPCLVISAHYCGCHSRSSVCPNHPSEHRWVTNCPTFSAPPPGILLWRLHISIYTRKDCCTNSCFG